VGALRSRGIRRTIVVQVENLEQDGDAIRRRDHAHELHAVDRAVLVRVEHLPIDVQDMNQSIMISKDTA
jgi:hypothetical protein